MRHGGPGRHRKFFLRRITWTKLSIMGYSFFLLVGSNREGTERAQPGVRLDDLARQHNADARPRGATVLTKAEMSVSSADPEPGVINSSAYAGGRTVILVSRGAARKSSKGAGHAVWISVFAPSHELLQRVPQQCDLHALAIEDAGKAHQHPKLDQYGDGIFIIARTAQMVEGRT